VVRNLNELQSRNASDGELASDDDTKPLMQLSDQQDFEDCSVGRDLVLDDTGE
jgi:hypothetical protein